MKPGMAGWGGGVPTGLPGTGLEAPTPEGREGVSQEGWLQDRLEPDPPLEVPSNLPPSPSQHHQGMRALFPGETAPGRLLSGSTVVLDETGIAVLDETVKGCGAG